MVSEIRCWIRTHPWGRQSHQAVAPLPSPSLPTHLQVEGLILGLSILSAKGMEQGAWRVGSSRAPAPSCTFDNALREVASDREGLPLLAAVEQMAEKTGWS